MTTTDTRYRVLGTTDESTTCDYCGRVDLKSTVVLDLDGEITYAGSDCASKMAGRAKSGARFATSTAATTDSRAMATGSAGTPIFVRESATCGP